MLTDKEKPFHLKSLSLPQAKRLAEITVPVEVEVGKLELSLEDLIDLFPGETFEFAFDPLAPLSLCMRGSEIAKAKFVLLEGKLALEIIAVGEKDAEMPNE